MAKYLYMDGVDDYLRFNNFPLDRIDIEFEVEGNRVILLDARPILSNGFINSFAIGSGWKDVFLDGTKITSYGFVPLNQKVTIRADSTQEYNPISNNGFNNIFTANNLSSFQRGKIFKITTYRNGVIQSIYDMSTGTVNDISGNGRHATLVGGTWMGEEEPPSGTIHALTSTINNYSFTTASLTVSKHHSLLSTIQSNSQTLATLQVSKLLNSIINILSTTQASLTISSVEGSHYSLQSVVNVQSTATAILQTTTGIMLIGASYTQSSTDGKLNVSISLNSSIMAHSETFGELDILRGLIGESWPQSQINGILRVNKPLSSIVTVQSYTSAYLGFGEQIIGLIYLQGKRELEVNLHGQRELEVYLQGKRELEIHLKGSV